VIDRWSCRYVSESRALAKRLQHFARICPHAPIRIAYVTMLSSRHLSQLDEFLTECFTTEEVTRLVEQLGDNTLIRELPGAGGSRASFIFSVVRLVARHGRLDARFFASLEKARPHRREELRRLAVRTLPEPPEEGERETTVWQATEAHEVRRLLWVESLEDALIARERCHDEVERAKGAQKIDMLVRHLRGLPHIGPGSIVAGTRLERPIGMGSFGTVWYAHHLESGRAVATKVFNLDRLAEELMVWRFRRSIRAQQHMSQFRDVPRGICGLIDVSPDTLSFCMPYLGEGTLEQVNRRGWSLTTKVAVFLEICHAVSFSHRVGVIHRDIKPANILLDNDQRPVLIDFDIADIRFVTELKVDQAGVGTPVFAAPEQLERADAADERSDIYSLGRLLYYLLIERSPGFQREDDPQLDNLRAFPPALVAVVRRATQTAPMRRHDSVASLIEEVERYTTGFAAVRARLASGRRWVRRHRTLMVSGIMAMSSSLVLNYIQDKMLRQGDQFRKLGQGVVQREEVLKLTVDQGLAWVGALSSRISTIAREASVAPEKCARERDFVAELDQVHRELDAVQTVLHGAFRSLDVERGAMQKVLNLEFDAAAFQRVLAAPVPRSIEAVVNMERHQGRQSTPLPPFADAVSMEPQTALPILSSGQVTQVSPGQRTPPKRTPRPLPAVGRESQIASGICKDDLRRFMARFKVLCNHYSIPGAVHVRIEIGADRRCKKLTPSAAVSENRAMVETMEQQLYPASCAGESRFYDLCDDK